MDKSYSSIKAFKGTLSSFPIAPAGTTNVNAMRVPRCVRNVSDCQMCPEKNTARIDVSRCYEKGG